MVEKTREELAQEMLKKAVESSKGEYMNEVAVPGVKVNVKPDEVSTDSK